MPDSLAASSLAVTGLSTLGHAMKPADFGAPDAFVNATPCSTYYGQQTATTLPQFQAPDAAVRSVRLHARAAPRRLRRQRASAQADLGAGQTVAITDAYDAPTLLSGREHLRHAARRPGVRAGQFQDRSVPEDRVHGRRDCGGNGWYGEQTLDVEAVHGMAPGANVLYYGAASCFDDDLLAALRTIVADNKASIVTNSWGEPTFVVIDGQVADDRPRDSSRPTSRSSSRAPLEGIGFNFSSGDDGDELAAWGYAIRTCRRATLGHPVGGTSLAIDRRSNRAFETGWGTAKCALGRRHRAGPAHRSVPVRRGRRLSARSSPSRGTSSGVVGRDTRPAAARCPTSAMDADPTTGMLVGETQNFPLAEHLRAGGRPLRRVPHRRHEPRLAALRGRRGGRAGAAGRGSGSPTR